MITWQTENDWLSRSQCGRYEIARQIGISTGWPRQAEEHFIARRLRKPNGFDVVAVRTSLGDAMRACERDLQLANPINGE